jgi:hypothetical protein
MNIKFSGVLVGMIAVFAATSASASSRPNAGHYEWRASTQAPGPRAPLAVARRVWVPATIAMTNADVCQSMMTDKSGAMACCASHSS